MRAEAADLPGNLRTMVGAFQMVPDPMARYKQLLFFASKLEGLEDSLKVEENKVQVSEHVFLRAPDVQCMHGNDFTMSASAGLCQPSVGDT